VNAEQSSRPNIVLIMADDMGWSDIGCYGSEILTPTLDALAERGLRFSQFYNTGRCCPTRASLLTGQYPHRAGIGHMTNDSGEEFPGYRGRLNPDSLTVAKRLHQAGYFTAISGKWHVGAERSELWPCQRGFDRFFGIPQGGGIYFRTKPGRDIVLNNEILYSVDRQPPDDFYVTDEFTDYGIRFLDEAIGQERPFFLYLAHIAPHWPLQAPQDDIDRYRETYQSGWQAHRLARHQRQIEMGLVSESWKLSAEDRGNRAWDKLKNSQRQSLGMAIYAAVVERMDQSIGRLVDALRERGQLENTVILFLSDNGGCAEGGTYVTSNGQGIDGDVDSHVRYGKAWANVSNTPFREYKHYVHEGGIATPLIVHWPGGIPDHLAGKITSEIGHVIDLLPTCLDLAGVDEVESPASPLAGTSLVPVLRGQERKTPTLFWEHEGNRAVRRGDWKLVAKGAKSAWELYNLHSDRTEWNNLAEQEPKLVKELSRLWNEWAVENRVVPHPQRRFPEALSSDEIH
ncbi:MAG: arylsulfatase, partial [Planctomycetaceae bacterium]|nr:arylsulfatase [Planctomycetaceae bacterium]